MADDDGCDDFMYEDDMDEEDYGFEYEDDDHGNDDDDHENSGDANETGPGDGMSADAATANIDNHYYTAKAVKEEDLERALVLFQQVYDSDKAQTDSANWAFRACKQQIKIATLLKRPEQTLHYYVLMLACVSRPKSSITKNYAEKSINNILDFCSSQLAHDMATLERLYQLTLDCLALIKNERLWVRTNLKLARIWLDRRDYSRLGQLFRELKATCEAPTDVAHVMPENDTSRRATYMLEIYSLEIQMYTETKNNRKLKDLYEKCITIKSALPHPRIMAVIRECGGKMHMTDKDWSAAQTDFFEAFRNYDEAGSPQRIKCLKYLVLATMLSDSEINPFDSQETKPYKNDPQILAMTNLIAAYQRKEIWEFERILRENRETIMEDPFIKMYIEDLLRNVRTQVVLKLVKPYRRVRLAFLSRQLGLGVSLAELEDMLVQLILDGRIQGVINQVEESLELRDSTHALSDTGDRASWKWYCNLLRLGVQKCP